ncbi:helix-turn-helix domain-containing protein [Micromonospora globispora]|uniref:helix-turn-helix domain-containing protein n=1 Tax=Micromonospora globispora TaxID=1450148 RepID=UPI001A9C4BB4|nr:helix-turn-helix domain-containing protein [Micromonospora globispora]
MQLRYNYRVYPTRDQRQALARTFGCARVVFNDGLRARHEAHAQGLPYLSDGELSKRVITQAKTTPERAWAYLCEDQPVYAHIADVLDVRPYRRTETAWRSVVELSVRSRSRPGHQRGHQHARGGTRREPKRLWSAGKTGTRAGTTPRSRNPPGRRASFHAQRGGNPGSSGRGERQQWFRSDAAPGSLLSERVGRGQRTVTLTLKWTFSGVGATKETATVNIIEPSPVQAGTEVAYRCRRS